MFVNKPKQVHENLPSACLKSLPLATNAVWYWYYQQSCTLGGLLAVKVIHALILCRHLQWSRVDIKPKETLEF